MCLCAHWLLCTTRRKERKTQVNKYQEIVLHSPKYTVLKNLLHLFLSPDREILHELDTKIKDDRKSASPKSLYNAGMLFWLLGRNDKGREYIDRMIKLSNGAREVSFGISCLIYPLNHLACGIKRRKICLFVYFVYFKVWPFFPLGAYSKSLDKCDIWSRHVCKKGWQTLWWRAERKSRCFWPDGKGETQTKMQILVSYTLSSLPLDVLALPSYLGVKWKSRFLCLVCPLTVVYSILGTILWISSELLRSTGGCEPSHCWIPRVYACPNQEDEVVIDPSRLGANNTYCSQVIGEGGRSYSKICTYLFFPPFCLAMKSEEECDPL